MMTKQTGGKGRLIGVNGIADGWERHKEFYITCGAVGTASFNTDFSHVIPCSDMLAWCIISVMWEDWRNSVKWLYFSTVSVKGRMSFNRRLKKANNVLTLCETEILNLPVCRPVPPFSGTLLPWAATYLTCVECKCKSWCISQWRALSSRKE